MGSSSGLITVAVSSCFTNAVVSACRWIELKSSETAAIVSAVEILTEVNAAAIVRVTLVHICATITTV